MKYLAAIVSAVVVAAVVDTCRTELGEQRRIAELDHLEALSDAVGEDR